MSLDVWQEADGQWRWRYVEPPEVGNRAPGPARGPTLELPSAEHYPTSRQAAEAAVTAYPGVPLRVRDPAGTSAFPARATDGGWRGVAGPLAAGARRLGLVALLAVAATAVSRWRRHRRRRDAPDRDCDA